MTHMLEITEEFFFLDLQKAQAIKAQIQIFLYVVLTMTNKGDF